MTPGDVTFAVVAICGVVSVTTLAISRRARPSGVSSAQEVQRLAEQVELLQQRLATADALSEARLNDVERSVEAVGLELERVAEGQRFMTKLLSEQAKVAPQIDAPRARAEHVTPH